MNTSFITYILGSLFLYVGVYGHDGGWIARKMYGYGGLLLMARLGTASSSVTEDLARPVLSIHRLTRNICKTKSQ